MYFGSIKVLYKGFDKGSIRVLSWFCKGFIKALNWFYAGSRKGSIRHLHGSLTRFYKGSVRVYEVLEGLYEGSIRVL